MEDGGTHYDLLQVKEDASLEVIKGAYKYLSQKWHPDRNSAFKDEAERMSQRLNEAYSVLSDPAKRAEYDNWLAAQRAQPKPVESVSVPTPVPQSTLQIDGSLKVVLASVAFIFLVLMVGYIFIASGGGMTVTAERPNEGICDSGYLLVTVTNRLPISLQSHSYEAKAHREGYSNSLYGRDVTSSDQIISPMSSVSYCGRAPISALYWIEDDEHFGHYEFRDTDVEWTGRARTAFWDWGVNYYSTY